MDSFSQDLNNLEREQMQLAQQLRDNNLKRPPDFSAQKEIFAKQRSVQEKLAVMRRAVKRNVGGKGCPGDVEVVSVTISHNTASIEAGAFKGCSSLVSVMFSSDEISVPVFFIGEEAFEGCSSLVDITFKSSVPIVPRRCFADCSSLIAFSAKTEVNTIEAEAFLGCSALASPTVASASTMVGERAFSGCFSLPVEPQLVYLRSELNLLKNVKNKTEFVPPQQQPRAGRLKEVAAALAHLVMQPGSLEPAVLTFIDEEFVPVARVHYTDCLQLARGCVEDMKKQYHEIRKGHRSLYADTLTQIRLENTFPQLQARCDALIADVKQLDRPVHQSASTLSELYRDGSSVYQRYNALLNAISVKTKCTFISAHIKGILRLSEKLCLTPEPNQWKPARVSDIIRGTLECENFTIMLDVLRILRDLDPLLKVSGETGGITDLICITRGKGRFAAPTSGGWGDMMVNFYFEADGRKHICEVQLVHTRLLTIRKNMGAHKSYSVFRAALELCEMVGVDPHAGIEVDEDDALLIWSPPRTLADMAAKVDSQATEIAQQALKIDVLQTQMAALEETVARIASTPSNQPKGLFSRFKK